ncbi:MAG: zf-HC2 domain-containing protein [Gemmatimonadales bacterium]
MTDQTPKVDCKETGRRIFAYIDGELTPERVAEIEDHLERCGHCAGMHQAEQRLIDAIKARSAPADVSALQARVLAALEAARKGP